MKIIGQSLALTYLTQGLKLQHLSPSLLFLGKEGIGKKTTALELSKSLLCKEPKSNAEIGLLPHCDQCDACLKITRLNHPDFLLVNPSYQASLSNGKSESQESIKIEAVRSLIKFLYYRPTESLKKVVVIDEAQALSAEAAQALLKSVEEPPPYAQLIIIAPDRHALPSTLVSRCAILSFQPLSLKDISFYLQNQLGLSEEKANHIAEKSDGTLNKALHLRDQEAAEISLAGLSFEEFSDWLTEGEFRKEARKKGGELLSSLIDQAQTRLEEGDLTQIPTIQNLLRAKKQIEAYVSPRLVLETVFLNQKTK